MRKVSRSLLVGSLLLLGAAACADLTVVNYNNPDAARSLETAGDVESLIIGSYNTWFNAGYSYDGPGMALSNMSFQHTAPWANAGMEYYGRIPREAVANDISHRDYTHIERVWYWSYRAIAANRDGLIALENPDISSQISAQHLLRDKAFARYVQGMAHASIAVLYDQGFAVDETTDLSNPLDPKGYLELMADALGFFDQAIQLAGSGTFTIPASWMGTDTDVSSQDLVRLARSMKARYRAAAARTPAERAAVNWAAVIADVDAGVQSSFIPNMEYANNWYHEMLDYSTYPGWCEHPYWIYGMADLSGNYQKWLALPIGDKHPILPGGTDVLIVTPDNRFPQGSTVAAQRASPGRYIGAPADIAGVWARPDRGVWRWSYYRDRRGLPYNTGADEHWPEINITEMRMLKAEGLIRTGNNAGAATLINLTRTAAGLSATDASGTNTSCVPKLPNGQCGNLLEMMKWEKRMEVFMMGMFGAPWFFDARGWGDLWYNTPLQLPVLCKELQVLQMLPCYTFGGAGGQSGSPGSTYNWPFEK